MISMSSLKPVHIAQVDHELTTSLVAVKSAWLQFNLDGNPNQQI